jgi:hypothetical protein
MTLRKSSSRKYQLRSVHKSLNDSHESNPLDKVINTIRNEFEFTTVKNIDVCSVVDTNEDFPEENGSVISPFTQRR